MKRYARLDRLLATNRIKPIARRCGRLDERGQLGETSLAALRQVRALAGLVGVATEEIDGATIEAVLEGRA